jgi:signal transduction histidine kinase/ligand-binding sensor domain-containing protein/DNA-binding response OmpR family regulator
MHCNKACKFLISHLLLFYILSVPLAAIGNRTRLYQNSDGLTGTHFKGFLHDNKGFVWIATETGLSRFDGYTFKNYVYNTNQPGSLNSSQITSIWQDSHGNIWVGTNTGLNLYDEKKDQFKHIDLTFQGRNYNIGVRQILESSNGDVWIVTSYALVRIEKETFRQTFFNNRYDSKGVPLFAQFHTGAFDADGRLWLLSQVDGVLIFDLGQESFVSFADFSGLKLGLSFKHFNTIHTTPSHQVILCNDEGNLLVYDLSKRELTKIPFQTKQGSPLHGGIASIMTSVDSVVWIGTEYHGLMQLDLINKKLVDANTYINVPNAANSKVFCFEDKFGDFWFGINYQGLLYKKKQAYPFSSFTAANSGISHPLVRTVLRDSRGWLWMGTDGGGLYIKKDESSKIQSVDQTLNGGGILKRQAVLSLFEDNHGTVWIGTYRGGVICYDGERNELRRFIPKEYNGHADFNAIFDIVGDKAGRLWFATNGSSLFVLDKDRKVLENVAKSNSQGIEVDLNPYINNMVIDASEQFWLATYNGFLYYNTSNNTIREHKGLIDSSYYEHVNAIRLADDGSLWLATLTGLINYDIINGTHRVFVKENGLSHNAVQSLEVDANGNIWAATSHGLSMFDRTTQVFKNYYIYDGLPFDEFLPNSSFLDKDGTLYFGGTNGVIYFNPLALNETSKDLQLVLTKLKISDTEVEGGFVGKRKYFNGSLATLDTLQLKYDDRSLMLEFSAIDFSAPEKIKYAVFLDGFDKSWQYKDYKQRFATYTNLKPGKYTLKIKWTNSDGLWSKNEREITITVSPPFWATWWANFLYVVILAFMVWLMMAARQYRQKMKMDLEREQMERQRQESIGLAKLQFFTNVSHEIRTPLTLLLAPLHQLAETAKGDDERKYVSYIERNTLRLQRLVNQLLDFHKIESGRLKAKAERIDLIDFSKKTIDLFEFQTKEKGLELFMETLGEIEEVWADAEMLDKILFNLLANAIKYTPSGGIITLQIKPANGFMELTLTDSGIGIPNNELPFVFDRFYQVEGVVSQSQPGTGIGLHLAKSLAEAQHGTLSAQSQLGQGSSFCLRLPLGKEHLSDDEFAKKTYLQETVPNALQDTNLHEKQSDCKPKNSSEAPPQTMLIIEDDVDVLKYLEAEFTMKYKVITANDGLQGLKYAKTFMPDIIVSDVMMHGMNGIELCKTVKSTLETSHIPIVLLTAKAAVESQIEGLEAGADDYIAKPFHPSVLKLKVAHLIESRQLLKERIASEDYLVIKEITVTTTDEKFLQRTIDYIMEHIQDTDLSVEKLCEALDINRVQLYRKMKALTNQNPSDFIRLIRLKQAAHLLQQKKLKMSEIAYQVGFNSHQYFSNCFQKHFKISPTEYANKYNNP